MYLHPASKQINSLILSSDLDTSKANHATQKMWLTLLHHTWSKPLALYNYARWQIWFCIKMLQCG